MAGLGFKPSRRASEGFPQPSLGQPPKCPECGSAKTWKDGLRYPRGNEGTLVQRYLCRDCGYRFSEPKVKVNVLSKPVEASNSGFNLLDRRVVSVNLSIQKLHDNVALPIGEDVGSHKVTTTDKALNTLGSYNSYRRVCVSEGEAKNSDSKAIALAEEKAVSEKQAAGATETSHVEAEIKGKLLEYAWWLKKQGYADSTIERRSRLLKVLFIRGANLYDPESVKETITRQNWSESGKHLAIEAYSCFLRMIGGSWNPPITRTVEKFPFIPTEQELDSLIVAVGGKLATFLRLLKETGMRAGEAWSLKWMDIDFENGTVRVTPEKGSNPRAFKLSPTLLAMLNRMNKRSEWLFKPWELNNMRRTFERVRNRLAVKLCNPRLKMVTFHTFRHWKATMEYAKTKDILHVMQMLGHKNIKNTLRYTQLVNFKEDEFTCKTAKTVEEAALLIEAGYEYVCEIEGVKLFRKRR